MGLTLLGCSSAVSTGSDNSADSLPSASSLSPVEEFKQICGQVFDQTTIRFSPEQVKTHLDRANELLLLGTNDRNYHWQLLAIKVQSLVWISTDQSCTDELLSRRSDLEEYHSNHVNISLFLKFYNKQVFTRCAIELNGQLSTAYEANLARTHLGKTVDLVRQSRPFEDNMGLDLSVLSQAILVYLRQLNYHLEKPFQTPMNEHNARIMDVIGQVYSEDCDNVMQDYGTQYEYADMYLSYDASLSEIFDSTLR